MRMYKGKIIRLLYALSGKHLSGRMCSVRFKPVSEKQSMYSNIHSQQPYRWIAKKYELPIFAYSGEKGKGIAADWNFAVDCAQTALVTIAHQDDVYFRDYTETIVRTLNLCEHPLIAFSDYYELRAGKIIEKNKLLRVKRMLLLPLRLKVFWNNRLIRRRILSLGSAICCPAVTLVKDHLKQPISKIT